MTSNPDSPEPRSLLLRDCSHMDQSVVERLRASVNSLLEWADGSLDALIRLDGGLEAFDEMVSDTLGSLQPPDSPCLGEPERAVQCLADLAHQAEQSIERLRGAVREVMMSMQNQDVIGQAVERAASALETRASAMERAADVLELGGLCANEIAEIHRAYRIEDDLHRPGAVDDSEYLRAA